MAQSKDTPKSSGSSKSPRRTRRKPRPVTIDLEATEVAQDKSEPETVQEDGPQDPANGDTASTGSSQTDENLAKDGAAGDKTSSAGMRGRFAMDATIALRAIPYALAAFIGGLLSLVIYVWFAGLGWLPGTSGPETVRMNSEIGILRDDIEKMSSELQTITGETIDGARSRLSALEAGSAKANDLAALETQVTALQSRFTASEQ
ncbi:MAG: hypothetical protein K8F25_03570, partial [Fimbriimonadaceae bacterium]|nr:hypothetical protein [Alphaproteobacteria bacterium]